MLAKIAALGLVAGVQCLFYLIVGNYFLEIDGMLPYHWLWMTLTAWTGTAMALVVSSIVKSERAALTAVPLLLVPQMLLAGALVPYREMNHGLFGDAAAVRDRGGIPVPAVVMPLRYAYEAMIVAQATRNPFEVERLRLQRRIDRVRSQPGPMSPRAGGTLRTRQGRPAAPACFRRVVPAGGGTPRQPHPPDLHLGHAHRVETMKVWPDNDPKARPASEFFVNERIDLLVREAETFRNDYRNTGRRIVFHALKKPIPFVQRERPGHPSANTWSATMKWTPSDTADSFWPASSSAAA